MLNSGKYKEFIIEQIACLKAEISSLKMLSLYNENLHCEYLVKNILNIVNGWELVNLNTVTNNYPSIDLGDFTNRVAVQVTSTNTSAKVNGTLKKFFEHNLNDHFDYLLVFILTEKQGTYTIEEKPDYTRLFDKTKHIVDFTNIVEQLGVVSEDKLIRLYQLFVTEFSNATNYIQDMYVISSLIIGFTKEQIEVQKRSGKYIPCIFIETSEIKELTRYFIIPKFYYRALDNINLHAIESLNKSLNDADLESIEYNIEPKPTLTNCDINECSNGMVLSLTDLVADVVSKIDELKKVSSSLFNQEPTPRRAWKTSYSSYRSSWFLDESIKQFQILSKRILLITSVAGKGKTNFICDLLDNVLVKRNMDCIFLTGNEFNSIDLDKIGDHIIAKVFKTHYFSTFKEFASYYQKIFEMSGQYLFIVIDGLNEVNDLTIFPHKLCNFIEILLSYNFIKLILSCRSEFFTERFKCLSESSFSNEIHSFSDFNRQMTDFEKEQLYNGYLEHFQIEVKHISDKAYDQLSSDPLLLRIFCEASSSSSHELVIINNLQSLNKEHIFERYYQIKIKQFTPVSIHPIALRKIDKPINIVFDKIVQWMLDNSSYSNIDIESLDLTSGEEVMLSRMINEDILLRKDLSLEPLSEYFMNFTYDEFRDFLIARYLLQAVADIKELEVTLTDILTPESPIFEGVQMFLFHISRRNQNPLLIQLLKTYVWYDELFIHEAFQLDDKLIDSEDLERIEHVVRSGGQHSREFIRNLMRRPDENETPNLNIQFLLQILTSLDEKEYMLIFGDLFYYDNGDYRVPEYNKENVANLIEKLRDYVTKKRSLKRVILNYLATVIFMLISNDYTLRHKSKTLMKEFLVICTDEATKLLNHYNRAIKMDRLKEKIQGIIE